MKLEIIFMNEFDPGVFDHYPVIIEGNTITCSDKAWEVLRLADMIPGDKYIRFERGEHNEESKDSSEYRYSSSVVHSSELGQRLCSRPEGRIHSPNPGDNPS